ncbi:putative integrator complex subunit 7 [Dioscorea sansibarensis]
MERIPAARAMGWSIELEKALRSNLPGRQIEAIEQIGWNLQEWSKEPEITMAVANMYGLVPGEDRTFANTILLRLADVFRTGDNDIRKSILKIFILELKHLMKKGKRYNGILAQCRVPNHAELLKRVKVVFDTGDSVGRCLALRLFGCWADLAKDSSHTRYMILLSLQSSLVAEVKASLFAAGCLCRLSEDFAFVVMEVLINMIVSESPFDVKLAAIHAFARLRCSLSITTRAYKAGKNLLASLIQDELIAEMLSSLSNLVSNSSSLIHEQVDLLVSMIDKESSPFIKARVLKCLSFLTVQGASFPASSNLLDALLLIIEDSNFQAEALQILQKIFRMMFSGLSDVDVLEILKVVHAMENVACSSIEANRCLALGVLMDMLCSFKKVRRGHKWHSSEKWHAAFFQLQENVQALSCISEGDGIRFLLWHVTSLVMDHLKSLLERVYPEVGGEFSELSRVKNECQNLFARLMHLAEEYPTSIAVLLDKVRCLVGILVGALERLHVKTTNSCGETNSNFPFTVSDHNMRMSVILELIMCIVRFVKTCFTILDESGSVSNEACSMIRNIIDSIQQSGYGVCNMHDIFLHCLHLSTACHSHSPSTGSTHPDEVSIGVNVGFPHNVCFFSQEKQMLDIIKKIIKDGNYWAAYKAGKGACSEGFWLAAAFTFRKLIECVQSNSYHCWFRSLILFSGSESEVKLLLFPKAGAKLINELHKNSDCERPLSCVEVELKQNVEENYDLHDFDKKLPRAYSMLCSSVQSLAAAGHSDGIYCFQMWFLSLRSKILEIVADMLGLLNSHMVTRENLAKEVKGNAHMGGAVMRNISDLVDRFANISSQLNKLAKAYDTLATSFVDIDLSSVRNMLRLALNCSLLAFSATFAFNFFGLPSFDNVIAYSSQKLENHPRTVLLQDLVDRLWGIDDNIVLVLQQFIVGSGELTYHPQSRTQINKSDHKNKGSLLISSFAVFNILKIHEDAKKVKDDEDLYVLFMRAMRLLSDIVRKWMELPFQLPKYFFRVRPCTGAELFVFNADSRPEGELSIFPGFQLSLNICIQLKNAGSNVQVCEMHCVITTSLSHRVTTGAGGRERQANIAFETEKIEEMVKLNEMLLLHLRSDSKDTHRKHSKVFDGSDTATTFISFEPNERGQGFSTCLLDVSAFPEGAYQIKWHCCCIDKNGSYWSLLPLNICSIFTVKKKP